MPELHAQVSAWAKINLDLRILAREASGYHQLETIFQRITLADDVSLRIGAGTGIIVHCTPAVDVPMTSNLAWRAASAYQRAAQWPGADAAITIEIKKRIPTGAGLGGGSADAGAVLRALNALNPSPLPEPTLLTIAAELGADVPFLTSEAAMVLAWGRGERMLTLEPLPSRPVYCALFRDGVNTADAYRALAAARETGALPSHGSTRHTPQRLASWSTLRETGANDFESPVFARRPDIAAVHAGWRSALPEAVVRMSGSGATIFAITGAESPPDIVRAVAATWPADGSITLATSATLERVPPVAILSHDSGRR